MRHLHLPTLVRRPKHRKECGDGTGCDFHDGVCSTCGTRLVDLTRDAMRARDPRY